ncbi:MAG: hypothetical protein KA792_01545 [Bacteroidales bacterium]|nr:hypothetical protein [Bacteroidales bacterium]
MYIQYSNRTVKGKTYSYPLLCTKFRDNGKIKTKVVANLSQVPAEIVLSIKNILQKGIDALVSIKDIVIKKSIDYRFIYVLLELMKCLRISDVR